MANVQFQLGPGLLSAHNVLNNLQQVNEKIEDCQEDLRRMHREFASAEDMAQELGYPAMIDKSIEKLEGVRAWRQDLDNQCKRLHDGLKTRIDKLSELSVARPDKMSLFVDSLDPKVQVFLVRLIPRVFGDRQSMLDISPQYKELILDDLKYLDKRQGPTLTQEQANSEKMKQLSAENAVLQKENKKLRDQCKDTTDNIHILQGRYQTVIAHSDRRKKQRDEYFAEVRRLVDEKTGVMSEKIKIHKELLDSRRHYKSLQTTSEGLQGEKDRLSAELKGSAASSKEKDTEIEALNNRIKQLVDGTSGTSKPVRELQNECRALHEQNDKAREDLRRQEQRATSEKEAASAKHREKVGELETQAGDLARRLRDASLQVEELREQNEALGKTVERINGKKSDVSMQLRQLRVSYGSKEETIRALEEERDAIQGDKDKAEGAVIGLQGRVSRMQTRIDEMKTREKELTQREQRLTVLLEEGEVTSGATVANLESKIKELENDISSLGFQHGTTTDLLNEAGKREDMLRASLDQLNVAHRGCGRAQASSRNDAAKAMAELSEAIVEKDLLEGTAQDLREKVNKLEESLASERAAISRINDEKQAVQGEKEEALETLQQAQEEVRELRDTRRSLDEEIAEQNARITSVTGELSNAAQEQQRLQESLDQEKQAHAGTSAREGDLTRELSECKQNAQDTAAGLQRQLGENQKDLERAHTDLRTGRAASATLNKALFELRRGAQGERDVLDREISTLRADLSAETVSKQGMEKTLKNNEDGIQQFIARACELPAGESRLVGRLAIELQRATYVVATGEGHTHWEILDSWTDDMSQGGNEAAQVPSTLELLVLELFGAAHAGRLNSKKCQVAIHKMSELLLTAGEIHAGALVQLGQAFLQGAKSQAGLSLEIGAAFWGVMTIVEKRWQSPYQAEWEAMKQALEEVLEKHKYKEAFAVLSARAELQEGELCHFFDNTYAVFCRPEWADAILFNRRDKSARFFTKTRFTPTYTDITIEPLGGHGVVTLPLKSDRDMEWALDWM